MQTNFKASLLFFAVMMFAVVSVAYPAQVEPWAETVMETPTETQSHNPSPTTMPTSTPTPQPTRTPTQIPTPSFTPTPSESPTPLPPAITSPEWVEYAPGSASWTGISKDYGNPYYGVHITVDEEGDAVIAWESKMDDAYSTPHVLRWKNGAWYEKGENSIQRGGIWGYGNINDLLIDPADQKIVVSLDHYRNTMLKYEGGIWQPCFNRGLDDEDGYEFWTTLTFLQDHTPIAIYHNGFGPDPTHIRLKKFIADTWYEFFQGSASENGIADSSSTGSNPRVAVNNQGVVFAVWQQQKDDRQAVYVKTWDGREWQTLLCAEAPDTGGQLDGCWISAHPICFDRDGNPLITYWKLYNQKSNVVVVKYVEDEWVSLCDENDPITADGHSSGLPILLYSPYDYPIVLFYDSPSNALYAKWYDGDQWNSLGEGAAEQEGIDRIVWKHFDAVINQDNELIVAYVSDDYSNNIYVKKHHLTPPAGYMEPTPTPTPSPIPGWFVLDGFGGIHSSNPELDRPVLPYFLPYDIVRDLEPDPQGRGWYMLDGCGGIHTSSPELPKPVDLPYFGFDIARNLEIRDTGNGYVFYLLDGYGVVHTTDPEFEQGELPWFGFDNACDLEPHPNGKGWLVLDRYGIVFSSVDLMENYPMNAVWPAPLVRAMTVFPDHTYAVMDAFAGRHTNPRKPARDVVHGLPEDFYFWGFDIIWDMEPVYPVKE